MRRNLTECLDAIESMMKVRLQVHPPAKSIDDLAPENLFAFTQIATQIKMICHCEVYIYGSRVNGNFTDKSDYDVIVYCDPIYRPTIKDQQYNFKTDIHFTSKQRNDLIQL